MTSIFIRTIIIYVVLNVMLKIMGKRQIGELDVNEFISALLLSEICALPISDTDIPLLPSLIPILFIASAEVIISIIKNKSATVKRVVDGEPTYIIYKGRLRQRALAENRISINEVLTEMRIQGIANIKDIRYAILEHNGKLSFLKESDSPEISTTIIIDTVPELKNIKEAGFNMKWVEKRLAERNLKATDVFLMTVNENGDVTIIEKEK